MSKIELWAGAECSVIRVGDRYAEQLTRTGHASRIDDFDRLASLGVRAVRFPVVWERTMPGGPDTADWSFADRGLNRLRALGIRPIVGLCHHGSGPRSTSLVERSFVTGLADFARRVAERYPWVCDFTPVNEPLTTARFSALYGHWYPHARSSEAFFRALLVECEATRAAMREIRVISPEARLVQTEDLGTIYATPPLRYQARFENQRRFLSLDLLFGRVGPRHPLHGTLLEQGVSRETLASLADDPSPPDVVGLNHYVTSDRFLDHRLGLYPPETHGGNGRDRYADVEAVRVRGAGIPGHRVLLELLWARYRVPLAITEVHLGCASEEQARWLFEAWSEARRARAVGIDIRALTVWSAFGAFDWDSLCVEERGHYEPGLFDVRGGVVRPTVLAHIVKSLAARGHSDHPVLAQPGWWRSEARLLYPAFGRKRLASEPRRGPVRPILVAGAEGTLGRAIVRAARLRGLPVVGLGRHELDLARPAEITRAIDEHRPWAVVNASGYVRVDDAERERDRCFAVNRDAAVAIAIACAECAIRHATFSTDLVFDGEKRTPYVESDAVAPLGVYGASKAAAEQAIRACHPDALIIRTSAFFGPWDEASFLHWLLAEIRAGRSVRVAGDTVVSPTYVPDLADAVVTLLVDGGTGVWHLSNGEAVSWYELARRAALRAELPVTRIVSASTDELGLGLVAPRPRYSALGSERGQLFRPLDHALDRFVKAWLSSAAVTSEQRSA